MCPPVRLAGNMIECIRFRLKIVTVLVGRTFGMFGPFGFGPAPQSSAGLLWKALDGFGWLWKDLGGFGRLWAVLQGSGRLLMFLEVCKRMWKGLAALRLHLVLRGPRRCELGVGYSEWRSAGHLPTPRSTHGRPSARSAAEIIYELVEIVRSSRVSTCIPNTAILVLAQRVFASQI